MPTQWGIKVWCAADSETGYLMKSFYTGKYNDVLEGGQGYNVVMTLTEPYQDVHRQVFADNFFTSLKLARDLLLNDISVVQFVQTARDGQFS